MNYYTNQIEKISPEGWLKEYLKRDINGFVGWLDELCQEASSDIFGYDKVKENGEDKKSWWDGETKGNWLDGLVRSAFLIKHQQSIDKCQKNLEHILEVAAKDKGYIGVYDRNLRYNDKVGGELWCQSRVFMFMLAYYHYTGQEDVLQAVIRAADLTITNGKDSGLFADDTGGHGHDLMIVEAMLWLYELTGDEKYKKFSVFCYQKYSDSDIPDNTFGDCKYDNLMNEELSFSGHGAHICEHMRVLILLYNVTGEDKYIRAWKNAVKKIKKHLMPSGVCKSDEDIINRVSNNATGIPLLTAGYEYCDITELFITLNAAMQITGEAKYGDWAEKIIFNAAQASRKSDGKAINYFGCENRYSATKERGSRWQYSPTHTDKAVCCVPNAGRIMPYYIENMWMKIDDGLCILHYGSCIIKEIIDNSPVEIEQRTGYPFADNILFTVKQAQKMTYRLRFRIPAWSKSITVKINDQELEPTDYIQHKTSWLDIKREWENNDIIKLIFDPDLELKEAIDGTYYITRGPLVYSLNIPAESKVTRFYDTGDFKDIDYISDSNFEDYRDYILVLGSDITSYMVYEKSNVNDYIWDKPGSRIRVKFLNRDSELKDGFLVPEGCTLLRKTTFNTVRRDDV